MKPKDQKGFELVGLIIILVVIALMVWGAFYLTEGGSKQNQIQAGQSDVDAAKNAANQENQYNQNLENQTNLDTGSNANYRSVENQAENLK